MKARKLLVALLTPVLALTVASCGGKGDSTTSSSQAVVHLQVLVLTQVVQPPHLLQQQSALVQAHQQLLQILQVAVLQHKVIY